MKGLVIVAHAGLARELLAAAEMIVGEIPLATAVAVGAGDTADDVLKRVGEAVASVAAEGAVIFTDMFGGTPSNIGLSFLKEGQVEVVTGVNLPMILEFCSKRARMEVQELASAMRESGRNSILVAGDYLK